MPRLEVIEIVGGICPDWLTELKQYASVPDGTRDAMLSSLLRTAVLRVQEYADRALVKTRLRLTTVIPDNSGRVRLYEGGGQIESITAEDGTELRYDPLPGCWIQLYSRGGIARITYVTSPLEGDVTRNKVVALRYATALYDGEELSVLNSILAEAR